ncbi:MAG TPA: tetratricopeptide repeat protein [Candidatus Deferrimicrobiaceae bacterium]|nr:tetratricopeptide repeat protein [Candidatus Deferrimicrobiaceae bacterium]
MLALDYDQARALAASSRAKAREARASAAPGAALAALQADLGRAVTTCAGGPAGAPCRAVLRFTLGTLAEHQADAEPAQAARWLGEAIAQYETILAEAPDHTPTLQALSAVHTRLGDAARAEAVLVDALQQHPAQDALAVVLGEFYWKAKRWEEALRAFAQAAASNSTAELPRRRMVQCHIQILPQRLADFRRLLREIEPTSPSAAESGYRAIIARSHPTDPATAEAALLRLVSVLAGARRLTVERLDGLPPGWTPVVELRRYLERPDREPVTSWWRNPLERRHILTEAALALGHQTALEGDTSGAATRWEVGRKIAPEYDHYVGPLRGFPVVRLDLQTALALHYFRFPSLDPGERKFKDVIQDLFRSKAGAYRADDLLGIERHHIVLGTIFAQKKVWGRRGQIDGALFQLDNALKAAAKRDTRDGTFQPLPEIRAMLAEALLANREPDQARAAYVDAAQAYLDTDELREAAGTLQEVRRLTGAAQTRIAQLQMVLETRRAAIEATAAKVDPANAEYAFKTDGPHGWMFGRAVADLAKDFVDRQRFKALADLADRTRELGHPEVADGLGLRAFKVAVDDVRFLVGANDLVRVERARKQATQQKVVGFKALTLERTRPATAPPSKTWVFTDARSGQPAYVSIGQEDLLAAQVVDELSRQRPADRLDFRVSGTQVVLPQSATDEAVKRRILGLPGVDGVVVKQSLPTAVPKK